jgi:hypothetical protein
MILEIAAFLLIAAIRYWRTSVSLCCRMVSALGNAAIR